jgi:hypothetical protein
VFHFQWARLGIHRSRVPHRPTHVSLEIPDRDISGELVHGVADALREFSLTLDCSTQDGSARSSELEKWVRAMRKMEHQLTRMHLAKLIKSMPGAHGDEGAQSRRRRAPFQVAYLVQSMMLGDMLRNSRDLQRTLRLCIKVLVPPVMQEVVFDYLDECSHTVPDKGTISRWRVLLDGAFRLLHRRTSAVSECSRYLMADSSMQHGRDFEHIVYLMVRNEMLPRLFHMANDLIRLWLRLVQQHS